MITLHFPFQPVAKGRPRFNKNGHTYTPDKTRRFESDMRLWAQKQMSGKKAMTGALSVHAVFILSRPKSAKKRLYPTVKPDLDNFLKCLDSLNGICWEDDSQIVHLKGDKIYAMDEAGPRITVLIQGVA